MINFVEQALPSFWPSALAVLIVVCAGASAGAQNQRRTAVLAAVLAVAVAATYGWLIHDQVADPRSNLLVRDVAGRLLVGAAAPLLTVLAAAIVRPRAARGWITEAVSTLVGAVWVLTSPLILLYIHCSSGDCL
jgi:hypothetical protein